MLLDALLIIGGLVLLTFGADGLVRGAGSLAIRLGVTPLVVGLTVVAFGTGSPELFLGVQATLAGSGELALGNVVGSNISNIALVLGIAALVRPMDVQSQLVRREAPLMIGATGLLVALLLDGTLGRGDGAILLAGAIGYTVFAYRGARTGEGEEHVAVHGVQEAAPSIRRSPVRDFGLVVMGLAALLVGANLLLKGAVSVADALGIPAVIVGLTVIAVGTSLPELATSITAARREEPDVAFGNAIGSNALNILGVLGIVALVNPIEMSGLRMLDLGVMVATAIIVLPLMARKAILNRWEGGLLLVGYAAYIWSLTG